jgi:PAS domain S-box-containing protein
MHLLSNEGVIVGSTDSKALGKNLHDSEVFRLGQKAPDVSVFFHDSDGELAQYLIRKITYGTKSLGYLLLEAPADRYLLITSDYDDLGKTGETLLFRKEDNNKYQYLTPARFDKNITLTQSSTAPSQPSRDYRDKQVLQVQQEIPGMPWVVAVKMDQDEIYRPLIELRNVAAITVVSISVIMVFGGLYFARRITNPLKAFTDIVRRIQAGNYALRVPIASRDEIGTLGVAFNDMTNQLAQANKDLEKKVVERTESLNQKVQELSNANAQDEAILDSIGDGMIVTDNGGHILLINTIAADFLSVDKAKMIQAQLTAIPLYDEREQPIPPAEQPMQLALQSKRRVEQNVWTKGSGGQKKALAVTATPVLQQGAIIGTIQTVRDVTKEKQVDRMKTEFISLASHQLRTPLSAIRWFTEMLLSGDAGKLSTEQGEFTKNIYDSTERMIQLVNSLLNISRIESGRIIVEPKPTDLQELVTGVVNDLKAKTEERHQTLIVSVHKELPKVNLDPRLIGQVYMNFLTNAIKYTPKGGEISVFVSRKDDELVSQITDNGYGIPKEQQHRVFQKFFRAENVTKVETDGTGLGLYLVKAIIESSGGRVWFESEAGKGTTFWFTLPMSGMKAKAGEVTLGS